MKYQYNEIPESMKNCDTYGFSWMEYVLSIPSPMFLVTSYKSNGEPNGCMHSWSTFTTANKGKGYYAILSSINKRGHLYQTLLERKVAVINFMSADYYDSCMATIRHNQFEENEISSSGLTVIPATVVDAPMVEECFMNLECRFVWEKEIVPEDDHVMICLEVVNVHIDEQHLANKTEETGILYNIHHPINPEKFGGTAHDYVGVLHKYIDTGEY